MIMKRNFKIILLILVLCFSLTAVTGCSGGNTTASERDSVSFIEVGEKYIITGVYRDSSYGANLAGAAVEVLEIEDNWIKVKNAEEMNGHEISNPDLFEDMGDSRMEWGHFWINLDNVIGIAR